MIKNYIFFRISTKKRSEMDGLAIVLYNFSAKSTEQISVKVGDKVKVSPYSKNWLYATILKNSSSSNNEYLMSGIIPKKFVKIFQNIAANYSGNNNRVISEINMTNIITSSDNITEILKPSVQNKTTFQMEYQFILMVFCAVIFIISIITNLFMLWFVKKKINKHKLLNKRYFKRENKSFVEKFVENKNKIFYELD